MAAGLHVDQPSFQSIIVLRSVPDRKLQWDLLENIFSWNTSSARTVQGNFLMRIGINLSQRDLTKEEISLMRFQIKSISNKE